MARIAGIDLPKNKRGVISLTYIFGIGASRAKEILAKANAVVAPLGVLNRVLETTKKTTKVIAMPQQKTPWYTIAASVAAFAFATLSVYLYQKNQALNSENNIVVDHNTRQRHHAHTC